MYWKNVKVFRFQSLSLVNKLMIFYTISTMAILAAIAIFFYPTFSKMMAQINGHQASLIGIECYSKLIIALLLSSFCAIILGNMLARKGLKRISELESKMESITHDSLHERINLSDWPKELTTLAEQFNLMLDRLESSFIQLSQFSSDIAHELRNPLNNLRGLTEIALSKQNVPEEYRTLLESSMDEYQHLSRLIENLLFLARSDNSQIQLNKESFCAREEITKICDYYQALVEENNIKLSCQGDGILMADRTLFKRVISNLLSNALRYTAQNGSVTISIKSFDQSFLQIIFEDTGIGIDESHQSKLFDRFYRVDPSRSMQSGGLGLGLAIVKSIVDLHQGKITVKSQLNVGTAVYLQLPSSLSRLRERVARAKGEGPGLHYLDQH